VPRLLRMKSGESTVNRDDLRILNYNKTVFGRVSTRTPLGELTTLSQTPESDEEGMLPPHSPSLPSRDERAPRSPEFDPHFLDQSYAPERRPFLCFITDQFHITITSVS